jgi:hypothetical protein
MLIKVQDGFETRFADPELAECSWPSRVKWFTAIVLYKTHSRKYWVHYRRGTRIPDDTRFLSDKKAAQWLLEHGYEVPKDLKYQLKGLVEV